MVAGPFSSHADKSRGAVLRPIQLELLTVRYQPSAEDLLLKLANIKRFVEPFYILASIPRRKKLIEHRNAGSQILRRHFLITIQVLFPMKYLYWQQFINALGSLEESKLAYSFPFERLVQETLSHQSHNSALLIPP